MIRFLLIVLLFVTTNLIAQQKLIEVKEDKSYTGRLDGFTDNQGNIVVLYHSYVTKEGRTTHYTNILFHTSQSSKKIELRDKLILKGHAYDENTYTLFFFNGYYIQVSKDGENLMKSGVYNYGDEEEFAEFSYQGTFYRITYPHKNNKVNMVKIKSGGEVEKTGFTYEHDWEKSSNYWNSRHFIHNDHQLQRDKYNYLKEPEANRNGKKQQIELDAVVPQNTKLFFNNGDLAFSQFSHDDERYNIKIVTFNEASRQLDEKIIPLGISYNKEKNLKLLPIEVNKKKERKKYQFPFDGKIFVVSTVKGEIELNIIDIKSGQTLKNYLFNENSKDVPLFQQPLFINSKKVESYDETNKTITYLDKFSDDDPYINVYRKDDKIAVTLGSYKLEENNTPSYGGATGLSLSISHSITGWVDKINHTHFYLDKETHEVHPEEKYELFPYEKVLKYMAMIKIDKSLKTKDEIGIPAKGKTYFVYFSKKKAVGIVDISEIK